MKTTCHQCECAFWAENRRGATPKYCSSACKQKAYRQRGRPRRRPSRSRLPEVLTRRRTWVRAEGKRPVQVNGQAASSTQPSTWSSYEAVKDSTVGDGYGIMLGGGVGCYDLDHVTDDEIREFLATVEEPIIYMERSVSGEGAHVFIKAAGSPGWRRGNVERYTRERFIRMTGNELKL